jgi:hypothetical protein
VARSRRSGDTGGRRERQRRRAHTRTLTGPVKNTVIKSNQLASYPTTFNVYDVHVTTVGTAERGRRGVRWGREETEEEERDEADVICDLLYT